MFSQLSYLGIWLHESGVLGASPDGIVLHPPRTLVHYQSAAARVSLPMLVEVKCPYAARNLKIVDAVRSVKNFCLGEFHMVAPLCRMHKSKGAEF